MSDTPQTAPAPNQPIGAMASPPDTNQSQAQAQVQGEFPPRSIEAFLQCCAGEWLSLRSCLTLGLNAANAGLAESAEPSEGDDWHSSERAELSIVLSSPDRAGEPGGLIVSTKAAPGQQTLVRFNSDGSFSSEGKADQQAQEGRWTLWPDGSLELVISSSNGELSEKIWFTKPNLRLRSTVETRADGAPGQASFSSEIRRVSRPAA